VDICIIPLLPLEVVELQKIAQNVVHVVIKLINHLSIRYKMSPFSNSLLKSLDSINDIFILFGSKIRNLPLFSSYSSILDCKKQINKYIFMFLLSETLALDVLQLNTGNKDI